MAWSKTARVAPGLILVLLIASLALVVARFTIGFGVGAVALGVLFGLLVGNLRPPGPLIEPGVGFAGKRVLAAAVVLLGLRVAFDEFTQFGIPLMIALGVVAGTLVLALLVGRWLSLDTRVSAMIGAGTGVCGVAAIAAVRPIVGGQRAQTLYAVATVTLLGTLGLIVFPVVQLVWHPLDPQAYGVLAGAGLHSVPQAVGAGFAGAGDEGGLMATVVKLTRVALLGPLVVGLMLVWRWLAQGATERKVPGVPVEVWGFLLLMVLGNLLPVPDVVRQGALALSGVLLVVALTALGLSTRIRALRSAGARPLILAVAVWVAAVSGVFLVLHFVSI